VITDTAHNYYIRIGYSLAAALWFKHSGRFALTFEQRI